MVGTTPILIEGPWTQNPAADASIAKLSVFQRPPMVVPARGYSFKTHMISAGEEYTPYQVFLKALFEYFRDELGEDAMGVGRSAVALAEFQDDAVKRARRILTRYDGVLIADSVGLGKTWIGKKLLEDFAYHRRQKAIVVCAASLREMWKKELASATIAAQVEQIADIAQPQCGVRAGDAATSQSSAAVPF